MPWRLCKRRSTRRFAITALILASVTLVACWYFGLHSGRDVKAYAGMALECHPVWKRLALRTVREGQRVDEVIDKTDPAYVVRHGRFDEINYQHPLSFTFVHIVAKDGKLIRAESGSCTWDHTFFNSMSELDNREYQRSLRCNERTLVYSKAD